MSPTRDFNYVEDTCRAFIEIAKTPDSMGETINIGSNYEISILDTLTKIKKIMNSDAEFLIDDERVRPDKSEVERLWCDNSKLKNLTGFEPRIGIDEGLERTINWFVDEKNLKKYKYEIYNV